MQGGDNDSFGIIFTALANPLRLQILHHLKQNHTSASALAKTFDITIQALQRHIDGLLDSRLVIKNSDSQLVISTIGIATLEHLLAFDFLSKYKDYFADHTLSGVPRKMVQQIGQLNSCEFIVDQAQGWQKAKDLVSGAEKFLHMMTTMITPEFYITANGLFQKDVHFRILHSNEMIVAKGFSKTREEYGWIDAINDGRAEESYVKHLPVTTVVSEKESLVLFANKKTDMIDGGSLFYSKDPEFRNWCLGLFNYYWDEVEKIEPPELREI